MYLFLVYFIYDNYIFILKKLIVFWYLLSFILSLKFVKYSVSKTPESINWHTKMIFYYRSIALLALRVITQKLAIQICKNRAIGVITALINSIDG